MKVITIKVRDFYSQTIGFKRKTEELKVTIYITEPKKLSIEQEAQLLKFLEEL